MPDKSGGKQRAWACSPQQITQVVRDTASGAHRSATAAAQLHGNAEELQRLVRQFKL